jgi:hypothetical protein
VGFDRLNQVSTGQPAIIGGSENARNVGDGTYRLAEIVAVRITKEGCGANHTDTFFSAAPESRLRRANKGEINVNTPPSSEAGYEWIHREHCG